MHVALLKESTPLDQSKTTAEVTPNFVPVIFSLKNFNLFSNVFLLTEFSEVCGLKKTNW
jgi:hypothetical protein